MMNTTDPWVVTAHNRHALWTVYIVFNDLGVLLCLFVLYLIYRKTERTAGDVFVGGLCSGCIFMSVTCGSQCLTNRVHDYFYGGRLACQTEAYFHVSAIPVQFLSVALLSLRNWLVVWSAANQQRCTISKRLALGLMIGVWMGCFGSVLLLEQWSPIYPMGGGLYCFYDFVSPAIIFMLSTLGVAVVVMTVCYLWVWSIVRRIEADLHACPGSVHHGSAHTEIQSGLIRRLAMFVVLIVGCWGTAVVITIFELLNQGTSADAIATLGVTGTFHSMAAPLVYLWADHNTRDQLVTLCGRNESVQILSPPERSVKVHVSGSKRDQAQHSTALSSSMAKNGSKHGQNDAKTPIPGAIQMGHVATKYQTITVER